MLTVKTRLIWWACPKSEILTTKRLSLSHPGVVFVIFKFVQCSNIARDDIIGFGW